MVPYFAMISMLNMSVLGASVIASPSISSSGIMSMNTDSTSNVDVIVPTSSASSSSAISSSVLVLQDCPTLSTPVGYPKASKTISDVLWPISGVPSDVPSSCLTVDCIQTTTKVISKTTIVSVTGKGVSSDMATPPSDDNQPDQTPEPTNYNEDEQPDKAPEPTATPLGLSIPYFHPGQGGYASDVMSLPSQPAAGAPKVGVSIKKPALGASGPAPTVTGNSGGTGGSGGSGHKNKHHRKHCGSRHWQRDAKPCKTDAKTEVVESGSPTPVENDNVPTPSATPIASASGSVVDDDNDDE